VAKTGGAGTDKVTFTGFETNKASSFEMSIDIHNMGEQTAGIATRQTIWSNGDGYIALGDVGKQVVAVFDALDNDQRLVYNTTIMATGANFNIKFTKEAGANTISCTITNLANPAQTETKTATIGGGKDIATVTWTMLGARTADRPLRSGFSNERITINGVCVANRPYCGDTKDIGPSGNHGTISGTVSLAEHSDYSTFRNDEYGFAVKDGSIYPKLLDGTGYAGLVGEPDATYQGLIATKGQPEIGTKQYLGTEYDFGDAAAITDAGISWDEWNDTDDNLDTVGTAETDLDTDYYNAITASLMTNTSIAGYAGTSNVSKRLFFKVADRVMKDDGSFLAESGRVQEIMVYKRDLTEAEILRVQKYCREVTE
jgi:hypothetical protein